MGKRCLAARRLVAKGHQAPASRGRCYWNNLLAIGNSPTGSSAAETKSWQVTRGATTRVTPGLADEVIFIFGTNSPVGKYDHVMMCNSVQSTACVV